jgi:sialidase-1
MNDFNVGGMAWIRRLAWFVLLATHACGTSFATAQDRAPARVSPARKLEGSVAPFLGKARFETQRLFDSGRFPNVVVANDGGVLAFWDGVRVRRSEDGGKSWGPASDVGKGFMGGGVTVDRLGGDILAFVEERHPPAPLTLFRSRDHGRTWRPEPATVRPGKSGNVPSMHMNEHGITLLHGRDRGRLLRASRWYAGKNDKEHHPLHYTDAIFSDDGGRTWQASEPFPAMGTGEAAVAELSDGTLYYNSRRHWAPPGVNARRRWTARSADGGRTWGDLAICDALPDGDQDRDYGLMGGMVRLPVEGRDVLLFSNIASPSGRKNGMVWASFDGGRTWPVRQSVTPGAFAYSSMDAGLPGTAAEGWVYLLFEDDRGGSVARFNLSWVANGELTGDGSVPAWAGRNL